MRSQSNPYGSCKTNMRKNGMMVKIIITTLKLPTSCMPTIFTTAHNHRNAILIAALSSPPKRKKVAQ